MRIKLTLISILIFALACGIGASSAAQPPSMVEATPSVMVNAGSQASAIDPDDQVWEMIGRIDPARALADLQRICGDAPICIGASCYTLHNRLTGSVGLQWAKDYIYQELENLGYTVSLRDWSRSGRSDQNLIARKTGVTTPGEEIYLVAHLDGVGSSGTEHFPSADDNASGSVDLLELARALRSQAFQRTLVLLFSTGEEQGALGVRAYLDQLTPAELSAIEVVVDIDMVGYDANQDQVMELWHGGHAPSLALTQMISDTISAYQLELAPRFVVGCG